MKNEIELSSIEATSYWWINVIKHKVREIIIQGPNDQSEKKFAEIFYNYTEFDWRNLYLQLIKYITDNVNNYIPTGQIYGIDCYHQDTEKKGHPDIKKALSKIVKQRVPDIRLADNGHKDSVIYTNIFGASVWYKSCGITDLPTMYEPSYIITGDASKLHFYNLLMATIATIEEMDNEFKSITTLRTRFCQAYIELKEIEEQTEHIEDMFNQAFEEASDKGIILGRYYRERYSCYFRDIDYVGLESYMDEAKYYANKVLETTSPDKITAKKSRKKTDGLMRKPT